MSFVNQAISDLKAINEQSMFVETNKAPLNDIKELVKENLNIYDNTTKEYGKYLINDYVKTIEDSIYKLKTSMLRELKILCELAGNLKLSDVQKVIYEEIDHLRYDSVLKANLVKRMIGEVNDEAIKKKKEIINFIKKRLKSSNPKLKSKNISTDLLNQSIYDLNYKLKTNELYIDKLNRNLKDIQDLLTKLSNKSTNSLDKDSPTHKSLSEDTLNHLDILKLKIVKGSHGLIKDDQEVEAIQKIKIRLENKISN